MKVKFIIFQHCEAILPSSRHSIESKAKSTRLLFPYDLYRVSSSKSGYLHYQEERKKETLLWHSPNQLFDCYKWNWHSLHIHILSNRAALSSNESVVFEWFTTGVVSQSYSFWRKKNVPSLLSVQVYSAIRLNFPKTKQQEAFQHVQPSDCKVTMNVQTNLDAPNLQNIK